MHIQAQTQASEKKKHKKKGFLIRWIYQKNVYEIMSEVDLKEEKYGLFVHVSHIQDSNGKFLKMK